MIGNGLGDGCIVGDTRARVFVGDQISDLLAGFDGGAVLD